MKRIHVEAARTWTCQRQSAGVKCGAQNPARRQLCAVCGKRRPPYKRPAHMAVLNEITYEEAVALVGDRCGICGRPPKPGKKLQRDHAHVGAGYFRGLLCFQCNIALRDIHTLPWLRAAVGYVAAAIERAEHLDRDRGGA